MIREGSGTEDLLRFRQARFATMTRLKRRHLRHAGKAPHPPATTCSDRASTCEQFRHEPSAAELHLAASFPRPRANPGAAPRSQNALGTRPVGLDLDGEARQPSPTPFLQPDQVPPPR
jgi:hypothetical protein